LPGHNRRFRKQARQQGDAHRELVPAHDLLAILSLQETRVVSNDYTIRFRNRFLQLLPPVWPGERGGEGVIEGRLDGGMQMRFKGDSLKYTQAPAGRRPGGAAPRPPEFSALAADASCEEEGPAPCEEAGPAGMQPTGGRSGRTPAEPYPPASAAD